MSQSTFTAPSAAVTCMCGRRPAGIRSYSPGRAGYVVHLECFPCKINTVRFGTRDTPDLKFENLVKEWNRLQILVADEGAMT